MANIIRIKRSTTSGDPGTLGTGELAYSSLADNGLNGGDRLYIGTGTETEGTGNAAYHAVIGGKYFTDIVTAATNANTASTLVKRDASGNFSASAINGLSIAGNSSTLSVAANKTLTVSNTLTFAGTDSSSVAFGAGGTVAYVGATLAQFAATTSAQLAGIISDETGSGVLVFANSPTLVTPTLGAATATSITGVSGSNLALAALGTNISITLTPTGTGSVDVAGKKITGVATPTADTDAANKSYVDSAVSGLTWKSGVNLLATQNVPLTGNTSTVIIDDHAALTSAHTGYRLLLTGQTTAANNGIYVYTDTGVTYTLARSLDADTNLELRAAATFVEEGTIYAKTAWVQSYTYLPADLSGQNWVQFSGAGSYTAGNGLTLTGTEFAVGGTADRITTTVGSINIASTYVGQTSITTVGTVTTGTWNATAISGTYGGTGVNNGTNTITFAGNVTHSGAFSQKFTATAATDITLPTTGTLATLAGTEALSNKTITASPISGSTGSFTTLASSSTTAFTLVTDATALGTAAVVLSGGLSIAKAMYVGTNITGAGPGTLAAPISVINGFQIDSGTY